MTDAVTLADAVVLDTRGERSAVGAIRPRGGGAGASVLALVRASASAVFAVLGGITCGGDIGWVSGAAVTGFMRVDARGIVAGGVGAGAPPCFAIGGITVTDLVRFVDVAIGDVLVVVALRCRPDAARVGCGLPSDSRIARSFCTKHTDAQLLQTARDDMSAAATLP